MRHRVATKKFNRDSNARRALLRELMRSLITHGSITTSKAKAKELKRVADKLIGKATSDSVAQRRQLHKFFGKRDVVNTLTEKVAAETKRTSGFVTVKKIGVRRGDNTELYSVSLVDAPAEKGLRKPKKASVKATPKATSQAASKKPAPKKAAPKKAAAKTPAKKTKTATEKKE